MSSSRTNEIRDRWMDGWTDEYIHNMNLIGLTSSRSESRTNAYMARILLLDGNTFSSCVRSEKHTLIVVYFSQHMIKSTHMMKSWGPRLRLRPRECECVRTYIWPAIALHLCLRFALRTRQQWRVVHGNGASVQILLSGFKIAKRGREITIW